MIVCENLKMIYIDVPKTGSATIDNILLDNFDGKIVRRVIEGTDKHNRIIPHKYSEYTKIATVRHPYTRTISQYAYNYSNNNLEKVSKKLQQKIKCFDSFLDFCIYLDSEYEYTELDNDICGWFSCTKYLKPSGYDIYLKQEDLQNEFNSLSFVENFIEIPVTNKSPNMEIILTEEQKQKIISFTKDDFIEFNYEK